MNLIQRFKPLCVLKYGDLSAGATLDGDSINMKNFTRALFLVQFHAIGVADGTIALYSGATDGATTSALTFGYAFGDAAQGAAGYDVFTTEATSALLAILHATHDNFMLAMEVAAADMDTANDENWLTIQLADSGGGQTGNVTIHAVLEPRYAGEAMATSVV